jgi:hypothetical protein
MTATQPLDPERATEVRSLVLMLDTILERVQAAYAQAGVDLPSRRYWTLSMPAVDCEQLVVAFVQAYMGLPGDEAARPQPCTAPRTAAVDVYVSRCVPTVGTRGKAPEQDAIQVASEQLAIDAYLLLDIAANLETWDMTGMPGLGVVATVDVSDPQGSYQSVTLHLASAIP